MGARAVQQLRETAIEIHGADSIICSHSGSDALGTFSGWGRYKGLAGLDKQANVMIDDLTWWTAALKARER